MFASAALASALALFAFASPTAAAPAHNVARDYKENREAYVHTLTAALQDAWPKCNVMVLNDDEDGTNWNRDFGCAPSFEKVYSGNWLAAERKYRTLVYCCPGKLFNMGNWRGHANWEFSGPDFLQTEALATFNGGSQ